MIFCPNLKDFVSTIYHGFLTLKRAENVIFLLHFYPLTISGQWKFPPHFLSSCAGNFRVFLVDSFLLLTDIYENAQLTRDVVF